MRLTLASCCLLIAATLPAAAADFTGFYAGVEAGYAVGHDGEARSATPLPSLGTAADTDPGLPPSAASAARAMEGARAPGPSRTVPPRR